VPPLPPKQVLGKDEEFLKDRAVGLSRFLNRIAAIDFLGNTDAFQVFLSRHENSLDAAKKEIETAIKTSAPSSSILNYQQIFPRAFSASWPDNPDEGMLRLKTFLEKSEAELAALLKSSEAFVLKSEELADQAHSIYGGAVKLDRVEKDYAQRPDPPRFDILDSLQSWSVTVLDSVNVYKSRLVDTFRHELEDVQSLLEAIKTRDALKSTYEKWKAKGDKWRDPKTEIKTPKQQSQKEEDLAQEEAAKYAVEVVTRVILFDQIQMMWEDKMGSWRNNSVDFSQDQVRMAKTIESTWDGIKAKSDALNGSFL